jgi:hypothetical protein
VRAYARRIRREAGQLSQGTALPRAAKENREDIRELNGKQN